MVSSGCFRPQSELWSSKTDFVVLKKNVCFSRGGRYQLELLVLMDKFGHDRPKKTPIGDKRHPKILACIVLECSSLDAQHGCSRKRNPHLFSSLDAAWLEAWIAVPHATWSVGSASNSNFQRTKKVKYESGHVRDLVAVSSDSLCSIINLCI